MPDEVHGTAGPADHGLDDLRLPVDRDAGWRPALPRASIPRQARGHCPETTAQRRDYAAPARPGRPGPGHEHDRRPRSLLVVLDMSMPVPQHLHLLIVSDLLESMQEARPRHFISRLQILDRTLIFRISHASL